MSPSEHAIYTLGLSYVPAVHRRVIFHLSDHGEATIAEIAVEIKSTKDSVYDSIMKLRSFGLIRVSGWVRDRSGPIRAKYDLKTSPEQLDAPRLKPYSSAQKSKRWRSRCDYARTRPDRPKLSALTLVGQIKAVTKTTKG